MSTEEHLLDEVERWGDWIRECDVQDPERAIDEITAALFANPDSCLWHETTRWLRANDARPRCPLCGSRGQAVPHAICVERERRGWPQTPLDDGIPCPCSRCGNKG